MDDSNAVLLMAVLLIKCKGIEGASHMERAYFKHSGLEATAQQLERQFRQQREWRIYGGNVAFVTRTLIDRRITFKWSF